eukprot:CAMPEP_0180146202 /NCGR_PEP_ID=MMETSP0986-20121125/18293_1 /TAXON_ID=697907 /ORGANISM="non described non described, Strain CCMP2293" /LENGTH=140 /DNA_ID=CAMNT_0022091061 /DNA_START=139 /DNA_END=562 /DNA_ORIENTATION=-
MQPVAGDLVMLAPQAHLDFADVALALQKTPVPHFLEGYQTLLHGPSNLDIERQVAVPSGLGVVVALIKPVLDRSDPQNPVAVGVVQFEHRGLISLPHPQPTALEQRHQRIHLSQVLRDDRAPHQVRQRRHVPPVQSHELL